MSHLTGIEDIDPRVTVIKETASVIPFLVKTVVVCGIGYVIYNNYQDRFIKWDEKPNYPTANVSLDQAKGKADTIYGTFGFFNFDAFDIIADQLAGLNYNAFVRVYNAFGKRDGGLFMKNETLIEFIQSKFDAYEIQQLSSLQNGVFFKQPSKNMNDLQNLLTEVKLFQES